VSKREELIARCIPFLKEVKNLTPGPVVEEWLNKTYGPGTELYDELSRLITDGVREGWAANIEINGPGYRRSGISEPSAETSYFDITSVYMNSMDGTDDRDRVFRGEHHAHPYGELNMVVPLDPTARLAGPNTGWHGAGWTAPAPGSSHYPEAKGGAVIALFFLPSGRIFYDRRDSQQPENSSDR